ncbi:hypothetical protein POM88_043239 [Heracleum sosnowskyi]|uniref:Uncharacterized protein n=1 Tax=Heracleum sosnowskyi TaxID=360622 RepID=A0AAD8H335_9APIA|nr:hypothetical protein POM88_043239 [Heracleum sosnowskyi]
MSWKVQFQLRLSNLRNLVYLDYSHNGLKGPIPSELSSLKILDCVAVSSNELEGPIQGQLFNNFTQLRTLHLSGNKHNKLTGNLLPSFHRLSFLEELHFGNNVLNGAIPLSGGHLSKLQGLDLGGNVITAVVSENIFHNLTMLKSLYMGANAGLVLNFSSAWDPPLQLHYLDLSSCVAGPRFSKWLWNQKYLYMLDISNGSIADNIPEWTLNVLVLDLSENEMVVIIFPQSGETPCVQQLTL